VKWEEAPPNVREVYLRGALLSSRVLRLGMVPKDYDRDEYQAHRGDLEFSGAALDGIKEKWEKELERRDAVRRAAEEIEAKVIRPTRAFDRKVKT